MIDWSRMTPHEVAVALRTIPTCVYHAWRQDSAGQWLREYCLEYGRASGMMVGRNEDGSWFGRKYVNGRRLLEIHRFASADDGKADYDRFLRTCGALLDDVDDGSGPLDAAKTQPGPGVAIDWTVMSPREVAVALRSIPKLVAYAWYRDGDEWLRADCLEEGCAYAAWVGECPERRGFFRGHINEVFATAEEAKDAHDRWLRASGWLIDDTDVGPIQSAKRTGSHGGEHA